MLLHVLLNLCSANAALACGVCPIGICNTYHTMIVTYISVNMYYAFRNGLLIKVAIS